MAAPPQSSPADLGPEEARLARAAAAGDGEAFASLYERYARRAYNLALRICGDGEDAADAVQEAFVSVMRRLPELGAERELVFGSYLFAATRNATYDLMRRRRRIQPSDSIAESAVPVGAGSGGLGLDPGDPEEDPGRKVLLAAQQEEIAAANARLPERQREALALRELEEMSYDEIAAAMEMNRNSVAQLISRARINLRDELRGTALASVAVSSPECERALPLLAARDDGQLPAESVEAAWLTSHLAGCHTCRVASEAMQEAGVSYRAWIPVALAPWLFEETMARAAELSGADWSEVAARRGPDRVAAAVPGLPPAYRDAPARPRRSRRRRRVALIATLAALLLLGGAVVALSAGGGEGVEPAPAAAEAAGAPAGQAAPPAESDPLRDKHEGQGPPAEEAAPAAEPEPAPVPVPVSEAAAPAPAPVESKPKQPPADQAGGGEAGLDGPASVGQPPTEPQPEAESQPEPEPVPPPPPPVEEPREPEPPREPPRQPPPGTPGGPGR